MLRSVTRPIPKKNVCLSYWTFAVCWVLILGVHVLACIFNGIYAYCYWNLKGTYLNLCLEFYEIGMPEPYHPIIAIVHSAMFAIHGVCILLMVGGSLRQYSLAFTPWSTSTIGRNGKAGCALRPALVQRVSIVYNKIMYPCALCGVNGQYFDVGLICRQIIETALQTVHAYQMSLLLPRTLLNRFYVVLLAVNCWSSIVADLVFAGRDEAQRRFSCIVFDCLLDLMSSMGVRLFVLASYIGDYDPEITGFDDAIWYDDEWVARALNEFRMVAVVSWFDLVSRTIFTIGLVTTTTSMKQLLWRLPRKGNHVSSSITPIVIATSALRHNKRRRMTRHAIDRKIVRPRQQTARSIGNDSRIALQYGGRAPFRVMYLLLGTWGIVVLGLHIHSSCQPTLPQCFMQVKPWAVCRPSCYLVGLDCHMLSITGTKDEIEEKWSEFDASTVVQLLVRHCPKLAIPELFSNFGGLHGVKVYNTTIVQWDEAAALTNSNHPLISSLFLVRVNMTDGILPVGFQSSDFPQGLSDIEFCVTNLQSLPDDLATKWPRQGVIYIEYSRLTAVPQSLILLEPTYLAVTGNPITILPPELFEIPNMIFLGISYTEIEELPRNVTQLSAGLAQIYLIETNIAFFWSWIDEFVERTIGDSGGLQAAGSIYCYDLEMIEAATTSTFRTQILPALSTLLMTPTKENLKIILEAVSCSHDYDGLFYPLQFEDSINAMNTLLVA